MSERRWLLAIDTATATIVVAAGTADGELLAEASFEGRYRHSQELLPAVVRVMEAAGRRLPDLGGIVVGTGPGAFTGLRVGLATAKTLAHELEAPIVGVSTAEALLAAVDGAQELWLPSGARDRVHVAAGAEPRVVRDTQPADEANAAGASDAHAADAHAADAGPAPGRRSIAVDLAGRASEDALALGQQAVSRLGTTLLRLGAARLARGEHDDPERLVPRYASPPRGAPQDHGDGGVAWSRDPR